MALAASSLVALATASLLAACASLPEVPRSPLDHFSLAASDGSIAAWDGPPAWLRCGRAVAVPAVGSTAALDPDDVSIVSWNVHKTADRGWDRDLRAFAARHALVLLQEAQLHDPMRRILSASGHQWFLASAFTLDGVPTGVMTASTVAPLTRCTLRHDEPMLRLPKTAAIATWRLRGRTDTLMVANLHAVNFTLSLDSYAEQLSEVETQLATHEGPLVLAGDLNTWNDRRREAVEAVARRLGLTEVVPAPDGRRRFFGQQVDRIYVRGLEPVRVTAIDVTSSDHNPVSAVLRVARH